MAKAKLATLSRFWLHSGQSSKKITAIDKQIFGWVGGLKALMLRDVHDLWRACTYMRVGGVCGFAGGPWVFKSSHLP